MNKNNRTLLIIGATIFTTFFILCIICFYAFVIAGGMVGQKIGETYDEERRIEAEQIESALIQYYSDEGDYSTAKNIPDCKDGRNEIGTAYGNTDLGFLVPNYMVSIPTDPISGTDQNTGYFACYSADGEVLVSVQ